MTDLFTNPHRYGDLDAWRREAVELHAHGPIHRIEEPGYQPFLAVIGHDAVLDIERRPDEFTNEPIPIIRAFGADEDRARGTFAAVYGFAVIAATQPNPISAAEIRRFVIATIPSRRPRSAAVS